MSVITPSVISYLKQVAHGIYPTNVPVIRAGFVDAQKDTLFPMITVREDAGESHPVFPASETTVIVSVWVKGTDSEAFKKLVKTIGASVISTLNKANVAMSSPSLIINFFSKTGGFPTWLPDEELWTYPITFRAVYEEPPKNNS